MATTVTSHRAVIGVPPVSSAMARQARPGLLGIHINLPATVPPDIAAALASGARAPEGLTEKERAAFDSLDAFYKMRRAYAAMMGHGRRSSDRRSPTRLLDLRCSCTTTTMASPSASFRG